MITLVWRQHRRWIAAVLLAHKPADAELEDLLQEVALKIVERLDSVRDPEKIRPWLRSVAVNIARSAGRKAKVRSKTVRPLGNADERISDPDAAATAREREIRDEAQRALEIVSGLPPQYREPLLLRSVKGFSQREIASTLGLPETTVETRLARARRMLRQRMREAPPRRFTGRDKP